jgi:hypothetical protein
MISASAGSARIGWLLCVPVVVHSLFFLTSHPSDIQMKYLHNLFRREGQKQQNLFFLISLNCLH